jgi:5,10-methylenetetrahydromethanopterin reductase
MRLGILFDGFDDAREMMRLAREAESAGADSVWIAEHMGYREAVVAAASIAAVTGRVRLVPTAVSPYLWHPTPTAMSFATLNDLAPGRIAIAISVGNVLNLRESGEEPVRPVRALREFAEDLRALWRGEAVTREALTYRLDGARMAFTPSHPIPIYVASTGPHVLALSGRIADGVLLSGGQSLAFTRQCLAWAAEGLASARRDPGSLAKASFIYFSVSKDGRAAVEDLKRKIAFLFRSDRQAQNIASTGLPIDHAAIIAAVKRRDLDEATRLVSDEAIEAFCVGGTPDNCRARLRAYIEAGVEEPVLQISGTAENKALALDLVREFARW